MSKAIPAPDLHRLLICDFDSGMLTWRERGDEWFCHCANPRQHRLRWNKMFAGKQALQSARPDGYLGGHILSVNSLAHRVIWAMAHGGWPDLFIDHINGERSDNRLVNLRDVCRTVNSRNAAMRSDNTSGVTGIFRAGNRFSANVRVDGVQRHLGSFQSMAEAAAARNAFLRENGFSIRHGERGQS